MAPMGGLSRRRRGRPLNAEVNIINLVDVMLVLLIIFMVTAPILQSGIVVRLPKLTTTPPPPLPDAITITVDRAGRVAIGEDRLTWAQFQTNFPILASTRHTTSVFVRGDAGASFGDVVRVFGVVRAAGIDKVSLVTESAAP